MSTVTDTDKYVLRKGFKFHGELNGERHTFVGGDVVELTERQFKALSDRFDPLEELQIVEKVKEEVKAIKAAKTSSHTSTPTSLVKK